VFSRPGFVVIPGVERKELFDENLAIFQGNLDLSDEEQREIDDIRRGQDKIFCRRCDYCQPCSEEIPIQMILGLETIAKRGGNGALKRPLFKMVVEKARNCSECGDCMPRCPYELPIPDLIKESLKWVDLQQ
jgi:predicted aldo/keto reductase-like oxidoreductase